MSIESVIEDFIEKTYISSDKIFSLFEKIDITIPEEKIEKNEAVIKLINGHILLKERVKKRFNEIKEKAKILNNIEVSINFLNSLESIIKETYYNRETHFDALNRILNVIYEYLKDKIKIGRMEVYFGFTHKKIGNSYFNDISLFKILDEKNVKYFKQYFGTDNDIEAIKERRKRIYHSQLKRQGRYILSGNSLQLCCNKKIWDFAEKITRKSEDIDPETGVHYKNFKEWRYKLWKGHYRLGIEKEPFWKNIREIHIPLMNEINNEKHTIGSLQADLFIRKGVLGKITEFLDMFLSKLDLAIPFSEKKMKEIQKHVDVCSKIICLSIEINSIIVDYYSSLATLFNSMIDEVDEYTSQHTLEVSKLAREYTELTNMDEKNSYLLMLGIILHDIGKFFVSKSDLQYKGRESNVIERINRHTEYGKYILEDTILFPKVISIINYHHTPLEKIKEKCKDKDIEELVAILMACDKFSAIMDKKRDFYRLEREGIEKPLFEERIKIAKKEFEKYGIGYLFDDMCSAYEKIER